jgi:hypothetical protein
VLLAGTAQQLLEQRRLADSGCAAHHHDRPGAPDDLPVNWLTR